METRVYCGDVMLQSLRRAEERRVDTEIVTKYLLGQEPLAFEFLALIEVVPFIHSTTCPSTIREWLIKVRPYDMNLTVYRVTRLEGIVLVLNAILAETTYIKSIFIDLDIPNKEIVWKPKRQLSIGELEVASGVANIMELLKYVHPVCLKRLFFVYPFGTEIFDTPQVQKAKYVRIIGPACTDEQLLKMNAEVFENRAARQKQHHTSSQPLRRSLSNPWRRVKRIEPKNCNSAVALNQYIKKRLVNLNTTEHEPRFHLYPHEEYDTQTIFLGLHMLLSRPFKKGTLHVVDSSYKEHVLLVFLGKNEIYGKRIARGADAVKICHEEFP